MNVRLPVGAHERLGPGQPVTREPQPAHAWTHREFESLPLCTDLSLRSTCREVLRGICSDIYVCAMTNSEHPWEPPVAGTEAEHLAGALDRLRTTFRWKADGLDAAGLTTRIGASSLTLGGLLKHLALVEEHYFVHKLSGEPLGPPWDTTYRDDVVDWEFASAADDTPDQLYALWDGAVERSRARLDAALSDGGLDQLIHLGWPDGRHPSLRRLLCDLIEEYGRHTGHADLLREAVDGLVGEDPPGGWRAVASGSTRTS